MAVLSSFWDIETSGQATSDGGEGKTTAKMKDVRTYTDAEQSEELSTFWDFAGEKEEIWAIDGRTNDGYPFLTVLNPGRRALTERAAHKGRNKKGSA